MNNSFYFPWWVLILAGAVAWLLLAGMHYEWRHKINEYFAGRRAMRRLKKYARRDLKLTMRIYDKPYGRHKKVAN